MAVDQNCQRMKGQSELIKRLTIGYSQEHDRIHMDCSMAVGDPKRLWITRRLADQLLKHMGVISTASGVGSHNDTLTQACAEHRNDGGGVENPVALREGCGEFLVLEIDIQSNPTSIALCFKGRSHNERGYFTLLKNAYTDWQVGFSRCYYLANWPQLALEENPAASQEGEGDRKVTLH